MPDPLIRPLSPADEDQASRLLERTVAGRLQVRLGEAHDVLALPGVVAELDGRLVGVSTYSIRGRRAELAVLAVDDTHRRMGIGSALIEAVVSAVAVPDVAEVWLVTTNDNLDALALYQRRGFRLGELRPGAVDASRAVKPSIPEIGRDGIPLRDELILVRPLA